MTLRNFSRFAGGVLLLVVAAHVSGCKKDQPPTNPQDSQAKVETDAKVAAEVEAKLAAADAVDGTTDKVVSKCPACALGMDGSSDHAFETSGYTLHFCSAGCKEHFTEDLTKSILALKIPGE